MLPGFLDRRDLRLLLFGGKGGAGKTTCAAATALRLAQRFPDASYLLVSTDPAHSLIDSFAGFAPPANLKLLEMDSGQSLDSFRARHRRALREIAARGTFLDDEDLTRLLDLSLPGLDELMAFLEIAGWAQDRLYDCIVADTAPSGHTLRMLQVPQLLCNWLQTLDTLLEKHRYLRAVFSRSAAPDELDLFLSELAGSVARMQQLLRDPERCRFVPVLVAEALCVRETVAMIRELERLELPVTDLVVNRLYPDSACPVCSEAHRSQARELAAVNGSALSRYELWGIPLYAAEIRGEPALRTFWEGIRRLRDTAPPATHSVVARRRPLVDRPTEPPAPQTALLLFGGKGGVGKTTLACATALWMARSYPRTRVLLFSTDPAHSLSDCMEMRVGPSATEVAPGLTAVEIDAQAEYDALRRQYARDLERFLNAVSVRFELAFDREAMERILDLAPPGLDEIMALSRVLDLLARGAYDVFVVDSAATGHLLRWLELPSLVEHWLSVFFELFLKYRRVFQLPRFSERLIEVSRNLKRLKKITGDAQKFQVWAVAIPTEMALEETKDLVSACDRMGIHVPLVLLNLMTRPSDCDLCSAVSRREAGVRRKYEKVFARQRHVAIYRQEELRGLARLEELAATLYWPAGKESVACVS